MTANSPQRSEDAAKEIRVTKSADGNGFRNVSSDDCVQSAKVPNSMGRLLGFRVSSKGSARFSRGRRGDRRMNLSIGPSSGARRRCGTCKQIHYARQCRRLWPHPGKSRRLTVGNLVLSVFFTELIELLLKFAAK
jgi:hypothetical protein